MNNDVFEKLSVPKAVMTMALPTVLSMLVNILYNMADTFFVGQTGDANQVAAVSLTTPVFMLLMAVGNIFGIGGSTAISRFLGQQRRDKAKSACAFCFYMAIGCGIVMSLVFILGIKQILHIIGASENTYKFAHDYLMYIGFGAAFNVVSFMFGNIVRAEGAAKVSMIGMMLGTVINIILDPVMILFMNMGVAGAAIATVIGNVCSVIFYLQYFLRGKSSLSISIKDFSVKDKIPSNVFKIGLPASLNNVLMSTANILLNIYLVKYGDNAVAAMGVAMKANMLPVLICIGMSSGVQPLVAYAFGARNFKRMKAVMRFTGTCNVIFATTITAVYFVFTKQVISIFINDSEVIAYGVQMLRALMLSAPVLGIMFIFNFSFQAMGKALPSLILSIGRQGLFFLPILVIGAAVAGLDGLIYAQPVADLAAVVIASVMFVIIMRGINKEIASENGKKISA